MSVLSNRTTPNKDCCVCFATYADDAQAGYYNSSTDTYKNIVAHTSYSGVNMKVECLNGGYAYKVTALTPGKYRILNGDTRVGTIGENIVTATANQVIVNAPSESSFVFRSVIVQAL